LSYAPGVATTVLGYQQVLRLLGETVAEVGAMNIFALFDRADGSA
jgi:hypothetical protein